MKTQQVICAVCGKPVQRWRAKYCSYRCAGLARQNYKTCIVCGKQYPCPPTDGVRTCGPDCSAELRRRQASELGHTDRIAEARERHVAETAPEDWQTAKQWVLKSPDGVVYTCKNLINFFREHQNLIDCKPNTAARGISSVKQTMLGTRKNGALHWKGWTLLSWDDCGVKPRSDSVCK